MQRVQDEICALNITPKAQIVFPALLGIKQNIIWHAI
jgi:hypothetical protein